MNLAKEAKDLLKESKKALIKDLELARWLRGVKALATKPESDSWILQVRPWSHTCQWHACLCIKTCSCSQIMNKYCIKNNEEVTKTGPQLSNWQRKRWKELHRKYLIVTLEKALQSSGAQNSMAIKTFKTGMKQWNRTESQVLTPLPSSQQRHQEKAWEKAVLTVGLSGAAVHPCAEQ